MISARFTYVDFRRENLRIAAAHGVRFHRERHTQSESRLNTYGRQRLSGTVTRAATKLRSCSPQETVNADMVSVEAP